MGRGRHTLVNQMETHKHNLGLGVHRPVGPS